MTLSTTHAHTLQNQPEKIISEEQEAFDKYIKAFLLDGGIDEKKKIIQMFLDIEDEEQINIHRLFNENTMDKLKKISTDQSRPDIQSLAVDLFITILEIQVNSLQYLISSGLLQHYITLVRTSEKTLFTKMMKALETFLDYPLTLNKLIQMKLIDQLAFNIKTSQSQTIRQESWIFIGKCFDSITMTLSYAQAQKVFDLYIECATTNYNHLQLTFSQSFSKLCKYLFRNGLHKIFAQKGNIIYVLELFQTYPKLIRLVFSKLPEQPLVIKNIINQQSQYLIKLFIEVIPSANLTLTLALVEIMRTILEYGGPKIIQLIWKREDILEELKTNLSIEKDLTINILQIYYLLITHENYNHISHLIPLYGIVSNIIDTITAEKTTDIIQKGLRVIERILEFEVSKFKDGLIQHCIFRSELRGNAEVGMILEKISQNNDYRHIRNMSGRILSRNFVKIQGNIVSIDSICKQAKKENLSQETH